MHFEAPCHHLRLQDNFDFERPVVRFSYSSLTEPEEIFDFDLATRKRTLLKRQNVPSGHDPAAYDSRLDFATAPDGAKIPISIGVAARSQGRPRPRSALRLRRLWRRLAGFLRRNPFQPDRSRLPLRHRPCARRDGKGLALVRRRQAGAQDQYVRRFHRLRPPPLRARPHGAGKDRRRGRQRRRHADGRGRQSRARSCSAGSSPKCPSSTWSTRYATPACR